MANVYPSEPDDIFAFVNQILLRSSPPLPPPCAAGGGGGGAPVNAVADVRSSSVGTVENETDQYDCESEEGSDASGVKSIRAPKNSKRSRAAEFHNLSEKRRRSRINEKMKALQNLIPNSNKTDKASMLDEAIEYLKQLQLQVQMLTIRNGLSLYPMRVTGALNQNQYPIVTMGSYVRNRSSNANQDSSLNAMFCPENNGLNPTKLTSVTTFSNVVSSEALDNIESAVLPHLQSFHPPFAFKENCRAGILPSEQMDGYHSRAKSLGENVTPSVPFVTELSGSSNGALESCFLGRNQYDVSHPTNMSLQSYSMQDGTSASSLNNIKSKSGNF